jgi:hypothetical protein
MIWADFKICSTAEKPAAAMIGCPTNQHSSIKK